MLNKQIKIPLLLPAQIAVISQSLNMALGQYGININKLLDDFNKESVKYDKGLILLVHLFILGNKQYNFVIKRPISSFIIKSYISEKLESNINILNLNNKEINFYYLFLYYLNLKYNLVNNNITKSQYKREFKCFLGTFFSFNLIKK